MLFFFQKMDRNRDGVVTMDEFIDTCQKVNPQYQSAHAALCITPRWRFVFVTG